MVLSLVSSNPDDKHCATIGNGLGPMPDGRRLASLDKVPNLNEHMNCIRGFGPASKRAVVGGRLKAKYFNHTPVCMM